MGLAQNIILSCCSCPWTKSFYSSPRIDSENEKSSFDINLRTVVAFREFGQRLESIETLCDVMNFSPPMKNFAFTKIINKLHPIYVEAAGKRMSDAAVRENELPKNQHQQT